MDEVFVSSPGPCSPVWPLLRHNRETARGAGPGLQGHLSSTDGEICPHWPHFMMANQASFCTFLHAIKCWTGMHFLSATNLLHEKGTLPFPPLITNQEIWNLIIGPVALPSSRLLLSCSVAQSCPPLWNPMDRSMPGFLVLHHLPEFAQTHVLWVGDAIQPSHLLSTLSPPALSLSHQGLYQGVTSLHQMNKILEFQLQHSPSNEYPEWFPLGLTGVISLLSKGLSRVFSSTLKCVCKVFPKQRCFPINHQGYGSHVLSFLFFGIFSAWC